MKNQVSITIDEDVLVKVKAKLRDKSFRNQSHIFEYAVMKLLEKEK